MQAAVRLLALLLALLLPLAAQAQDAAAMMHAWEMSKGEERILDFVSDVKIAKNGDLDVTETIRLVSLAQEIKRGIQRDFPTRYKNKLGQNTSVGFDVVSVRRDGQDEPFVLMDQSNGVRVRIGDADTMLPPGEHVYEIRYTTDRQIIFGEQHDELYWNATGNGWTFPIDRAEASITLPSPAAFGDRAAYTGPQGSTARDAMVSSETPGRIVFVTTAPLARENGLTVAAAFPKGVVDQPGPKTRLGWWLHDWGALALALLALPALGLFYFKAWLVAGRGPRAGTLVPQFSPPEGLSAAAARFVSRMGMDNRAFTAAIVDTGVRGHLRMTKEEGGWLSRDTTTLEKTAGAASLPNAERAMLSSLFSGQDTIELKQANHATLSGARKALESNLQREFGEGNFLANRSWAFAGLFWIFAAMLGIAFVAVLVSTLRVGIGAMLLAPAALGCLLLVRPLYRRATGPGKDGKVLAWIGMVAAGIVGAFASFGAFGAAMYAGGWPVLLPLLMLPFAVTAFRWMYAPTLEGRALMDRIEGFKHYLGITEEDRLETLHPPEKTPELFERYLPYAIALDVENRWADKFAGVLAAAAAAGATGQTMGWYSGRDNVWDDPQGFAGSVGDSLDSTVSSAATAPSSSSGGSSGGGSSGGGGGGGGGSGW